jgi:hypothetical protein
MATASTRDHVSTVPPERMGSCLKCHRLILAYTFGADRPTFGFDPSGIDRTSIRSHLGVPQANRQGFGPGQGDLHSCTFRTKGGAP